MSRSRVIAPNSHIFTALMVGYYATGKTALLSRFARNAFDEQYRMTLNSCQALRLFSIEGYKSTKLKLVDSLGNGFGKQMVTNCFPECDAILLVYDITNQQSFYRLDKWLGENKRVIKKHVVLVLVGTHLDQPYKRKVSPEEAMQWKKKNKIDLLFQVSSKTNQNIPELFQEINKHLFYSRYQSQEQAFTEQMNPEVSLILEDRDYHHQNSTITILQKKLEFKQMQCDRLWLDYQEALRRISQLQVNRSDRSEGSNLLSSIKDYETDIDQIDNKKKAVEDNLKVLQQFYNQRQEALEETTAKKIQKCQRRIEELQTQLTTSNQLLSRKQASIKDLAQQTEQLKIKLGGLEYDYSLKDSQLEGTLKEIGMLVNNVNEKSSLLDVDESLPTDEYKYAPLAYLGGKFNYLISQLSELNNLVFTQNYEIKVAKQKHEQDIIAITTHINDLLLANQDLSHQIEGFEQQLKWYRIESIFKEGLQKEVEKLNHHIAQIEHQFDSKCEQYIEIIEQKEKAIKIIVEHSKELQNKLEKTSQQKEKLSRDFAQKNLLLQKKEQILEKVVGEKLNEINQLRGFIQQLGKSSANIVKKYSGNLDKNDDKTRELLTFFTHFFEKFQTKSDSMLDSFRQIQANIEHFSEGFSKLRQNLSQKLFSTQNFLYSHLHEKDNLPNKLQGVSSILEALSDQLNEICNNFENNLAEINENMEQIEDINRLGVEQYVIQYFN